jgi:hypothetical protein
MGQLVVCNAAQTGWDTKATCPSQELCDPIQQKCLVCVAGQYRCNAMNALEVCKPDGMAFEKVKTCAAPSQCNATRGDCIGTPDAGPTDAGSQDARTE